MKKEQALRQLLTLYLRINPDPSDEQFHNLAYSVGVDKEYLESISYEMLAESPEIEASSTHSEEGIEVPTGTAPEVFRVQEVDADVDAPGDDRLSEQQDVLDGDYDPFTTSPDDLILNDGAPAGTSSIEENQDATYDDGVSVDDVGIDVSSDKNAMIDDGVQPIKLRATARLGIKAAQAPKMVEMNRAAQKEVQEALKKGGLVSQKAISDLVIVDGDDVGRAREILTKAGYTIDTTRKGWISVQVGRSIVIFVQGLTKET